jgi:hypothetical protein
MVTARAPCMLYNHVLASASGTHARRGRKRHLLCYFYMAIIATRTRLNVTVYAHYLYCYCSAVYKDGCHDPRFYFGRHLNLQE